MMVSQNIQTRRGYQAGAVSPTGFRPAPPGVSRGRRLIHTPGPPWRCQTQQRAAQSAPISIHRPMSWRWLQWLANTIPWSMPGPWPDRGPSETTNNRACLRAKTAACSKQTSTHRCCTDQIRRLLPQTPHTPPLAVRPGGALPCLPRPERDGGGWFVCVLGSVSKTRATSRAVCWFSRQRGC